MKKGRVLLAVALVAAAGLAGGVYYFATENDRQVVSYPTVAVARGDVRRTVTGTGNVRAGDTVDLFIKSTQTVGEVLVKEGDVVSVGEVLVVYDIEQEVRELNRKLAEAAINLENARLNLTSITLPAEGNELLQYQSEISLAKKNIADAENDLKSTDIKISQQKLLLDDYADTVSRNERLLASDSISRNQYDASLMAYKNAQEDLNNLYILKETKEQALAVSNEQYEYSEQRLINSTDRLSNNATMVRYRLQENVIKLAELEIEQLREDLSKLIDETVSPIAGNVTGVYVKQGGVASKSSPVIRISDTSEIKAEMEMAEYDAPLIALGQQAEISTSGLPGKIYAGTVTKLAAEAIKKEDSSDGDIILPVEITIDSTDEQLRVGYTVDINIIAEQQREVLYLPSQSVFIEDGKTYVYVHLPEANNMVKTEVQTGLYGDKTVEITDGVKEGGLVAANPRELR